jgi:Peptidase family M13
MYTHSIDACGGWEKRVEIPSDRSRYGTIDQVSEENDRILRDIFSGPYPSNSPKKNLPDPTEAVDVQNFHKLQDAYNACLNETAIDEQGAKPLLSLLQNVISKYPIVSTCDPMKFQPPNDAVTGLSDKQHCSETQGSLTEVIEYLQSIGVGALFSLVVTVLIPRPFCETYISRRIRKILVSILYPFINMARVSRVKIIIPRKTLCGNTKKQYQSLSLQYLERRTSKSSTLTLTRLLHLKRF